MLMMIGLIPQTMMNQNVVNFKSFIENFKKKSKLLKKDILKALMGLFLLKENFNPFYSIILVDYDFEKN